MSDERLYGIPGAENMYFDLAGAYEAQIEPYHDNHDNRPAVIEEWTVRDPASHLPDLDWMIDDIVERISDNELDENGWDAWSNAADGHVKAAFRAALDLWASKVSYRMADTRVVTHQITWDDDNKPLADGELIYGDAKS